MNNDPWKHRSKGMRCATCMWFVCKAITAKDTEKDRGNIGRCRRHARQLLDIKLYLELIGVAITNWMKMLVDAYQFRQSKII